MPAYPENAAIDRWLTKEEPEEVLEPELEIVDPVMPAPRLRTLRTARAS